MRYFTTTSKLALIAFVLVIITVSTGTANQKDNLLLNPGAEQGKNELPSIWFKAAIPAKGLRMYRDSNEVHSGTFSFAISNTHEYDQTVCNNWAQKILNIPVGKTIRLSAYIKTKDADSVNVCLQCWGPSRNMVAFASTNVLRGDYDWTFLHTEPVTVPPETTYICVRAVLTGLGEAWFDDLSVVVVETATKATQETEQPKDFMDAELTKIVKGKIIKTFHINKDCMILSYMSKWNHGNVDNIAVANNNGGVRTLLAWPQIHPKDANDPNFTFLLTLYSRKTTLEEDAGAVEAYEILEEWPERTSWETQPKTSRKPIAKFDFVTDEGWKLFDVTTLIRNQLESKRKSHGLMLRFTQENRSNDDWSGYAFVSREGLGEWLVRRPILLIVDMVK